MNKSSFSNKVLLILIGIVVGWQINKFLSPDFDNNSKKLLDAYRVTKEYYIDSISPDSLVDMAIEGMFSRLDPFTIYIPPESQEYVEEQFNGQFDGIGVEFQIINDTINVVSPITGGPSEELGILPGDKIVGIEGKSAVGLSSNDVMKLLRGEKGSEVAITIYRPGSDETVDYSITRDAIPIHAVDIALMYNDSLGYVSLARFGSTAVDEVISAIKTLQDSGMTHLILDLRNNPGGLLDQAVGISDLFLSGDKMIVYTDGRLDQFDKEYRASKSYPYEDMPLTILINSGSASASEIVAGAIQDWDRGVIVGKTSYGKGLVQVPFNLADDSAVRITISKYYTPSGRAIQKKYETLDDYYPQFIVSTDDDSTDGIDTTKTEYKTKHGRSVYDGGGITPDYKVENFTFTNYTAELRSSNLFYRFIRNKFNEDKNFVPAELSSNLKYFKKNFNFNKDELGEFVKFAESNGVEANSTDFRKDEKYISTLLKAYTARELWKDKGWYYVILDIDNQFKKAVELQGETLNMIKMYESKEITKNN